MHPAWTLPLSAVCLGGLCLSWLASVEANGSPEAVVQPPEEPAVQAGAESGPGVAALSAARRVRAIGNTAMLSADHQRALAPTASFQSLMKPEAGEWLATYHEPGQTFDAFVESRPNRVSQQRRRLYIVPIGSFNNRFYPRMRVLAEFAEAYFGLDAVVLPVRDVEGLNVVERHTEQGLQLKSSSVLEQLSRDLPADAYAVLGITDDDLFPHDKWSYAFGQASLHGRVAVQSLSRLDPALEGHWVGTAAKRRRVILSRALRVMSHELGHVFGFEHCVYYECAMGGSNSVAELSAAPAHLCPVCLHKLLWANDVDVVRRYRRLASFYRRYDLLDDAKWVADRVAELQER